MSDEYGDGEYTCIECANHFEITLLNGNDSPVTRCPYCGASVTAGGWGDDDDF